MATKATKTTTKKTTKQTAAKTAKVVAEPVATPAVDNANADKIDKMGDALERLERLQQALLDLSSENIALKAAMRTGGGERVVIENTGYVQIAVPIDGEPTLILDTFGTRKSGSVPVQHYERLLRDTDLFAKGFLRKVGEVSDNPNIVQDPEGWVERRDEAQLREDAKKLDSLGPINLLWNYIETQESPTGKLLVLRTALSARYEELTGCELV